MISKIEEFMRGKFHFLMIDQVQTKIDQFVDQDEDNLMAMSLEIEREDGTFLDEGAQK
jgi:hypothetical protein